MTDSRINYTVVGAFVVLMVAVLVVLVTVIGGRSGSTDSYYTVYNNVGGLKYGTQVLYEGFPIGQVEDIVPERTEGDTRFKVLLSVKEGWGIPSDSIARIAASGLLAAVTINITGGHETTMIAAGGEIPGRDGGNIFSAMSDVAGEMSELSRSGLRPLLETLNTLAGSLNGVATQEIPSIAKDVRRMSGALADKVPVIATNLAAVSSKLDTQVLSENNMNALTQTLGNTQQATAQLGQMSKSLSGMSDEVRTLVKKLDGVVTDNRPDVRAAVQDLRYSLGTIARSIDSMTANMDATSRHMAEFSRSIRQNPALLIGGKAPADEETKP